MILRWFRRDDGGETIQRLYGAIVAQARDPAFYTDYGVPDTIEGRFEMILVHAFALFHRLRDEPEERRALGQKVFDRFCFDMDANLREMGVGDLTVPKKMKRVAEAFYGRVGVYDAALAAPNPGELAAALLRNVYAGAEGRLREAAALADYMRAAATGLAAQPFETLASGRIDFPAAQGRIAQQGQPS
ncbi:ubiquinol-cytochrome C chaperone family protein [Bosea sp. 117]|uniref:ubiquinol-cytochrome C chaperone family protein n=1 Tax=Bosea sp. 117 TaxID=1125973 RepID=UPI00068A78C4|nr:ubiquinol-cytochrome C chaperone family protein [Bosea sp. 117]